MSTDVDAVLAAIDGALDSTLGTDAMRWRPEGEPEGGEDWDDDTWNEDYTTYGYNPGEPWFLAFDQTAIRAAGPVYIEALRRAEEAIHRYGEQIRRIEWGTTLGYFRASLYPSTYRPSEVIWTPAEVEQGYDAHAWTVVRTYDGPAVERVVREGLRIFTDGDWTTPARRACDGRVDVLGSGSVLSVDGTAGASERGNPSGNSPRIAPDLSPHAQRIAPGLPPERLRTGPPRPPRWR